MPAWLTGKLIGALIVAIIIGGLVADRARWMSRAHGAENQVQVACDATRAASNIKRLDCKQMPLQIQYMGNALRDVRTKTAEAKAADLAHARDIETKQTQAGQEISRDYQAQLTAARARYDELMRRTAARRANPSGGGTAGVPGAPPAAGGPGAAAQEDGLPPEDALIATEQALQLQAILDWGKRVGIVTAPPH